MTPGPAPTTTDPGATPSWPHRAPSLERRLPLLMSGVLAMILFAALVVTYVTLARSATASAVDRMQRGVRQLAVVSGTAVSAGRPRYRGVANDSVVRRAVRAALSGAEPAPADTFVRAALARLQTPTDSGMPIELWTADGRRVSFIGNDLRTVADTSGQAVRSDRTRTGMTHVPREGLESIASADSMALGALYADSGRVFFWIVAPVFEQGVPIGYVAQQRRIASNSQIERTLRELTGDSVTAYYHNRHGGFWTTIAGTPAAAPVNRDSSAHGLTVSRPGVGELLTAEDTIAGTKLLLSFELPRRRVLAAPRAAALQMAGISLVLLVVGALISRVLSRRITRPIVSLTAAAEAIAQGNYTARAEARGDDEVARLAASFNRMAGEIAAAQQALERRSTEAQAAAAELARSNTELGDARVTAENASRAKSDFLAVMSHELRTPLNAIGGYTELMQMELRGPITELQRRDLERIRLAQQHLLGLISGVLDMSRIEAGQVSYQPVPIALAPFLAELEGLVLPQAGTRQITLGHTHCARDVAVVADREKLRQTLLNLLSNAIRYTPSGGSVAVSARALDEHTVAIEVRDTGLGIAPEQQAQIFEPFVQLDRSLSSVREGVGLGLAISRDLARGMGGDLTVESRVGKGSCFTLTLPRGAADEAAAALVTSGEHRGVH